VVRLRLVLLRLLRRLVERGRGLLGLLLGGVLVAHASSLRREPVRGLRAGWEVEKLREDVASQLV
jgi:hypothetical protein